MAVVTRPITTRADRQVDVWEARSADRRVPQIHRSQVVSADKAVRAAQAQQGEASAKLALAGGVSANRALREEMAARAAAAGIRFFCPDLAYCTDNAAMVGSAAYGRLLRGAVDDFSLNAVPYLPIGEETGSA